MPKQSRRSFVKAVAGASIAFPFIGWKTAAQGKTPSSTVRVAAFGANGRAWSDITGTMNHPNTVLVAVAEIDPARSNKARETYPEARIYLDWRELLEKEEKNIDVAVVGTPDHMHAPIAMSAMQLGKHCYCEKPLTRTIHEARQLTEFAAANNLKTQMGNQLASSSGNKATAKALADRMIGDIISIHCTCPKSWGSMSPLGPSTEPPEGLDWEQWIGVSKMRPYVKGEYHPGQWRKRIGIGTGTLGDMACHIVHPWIKGLDAPAALSVKSTGPAPVDGDSWPLDGQVEYRMSANERTNKDFDFTWYDGKNVPGDHVAEAVGGRENVPKMGSIIIGTKGAITANHGRDPEPKFYRDGKRTEESVEPPPGADHHGEWIDAVLGNNKETVCDFAYSGPMTETVLLGTVAMQLPGKELKWDSKKLRFSNSNKANKLAKEPYRNGWKVKGI